MCAQTYGYFDIGEHAWMLLDRVRVDAFARAIFQVVQPGHVVADIGTGTGILAVLAAKAGARRVFAVDKAPIVHVAKQLFQENGVSDQVEIIRQDARELEFPEPPDVIISEMVGNFGIEEDILGIFSTLKSKCSPNVQFVPRGLKLSFAPLFEEGLHKELDQLENGIAGLSMASFRNKMINRPVHHRIQKEELRGSDLGPLTIDFLEHSHMDEMRATLTVDRAGPVNAIGTWYELDLADGVSLTTGPSGPPTHWTNFKFPLYPPLELEKGAQLELSLYPKLLPGAGVWSWEVKLEGTNERRAGDSMATLMGSAQDLLGALRLRRGAPRLKENPTHLRRLTAALSGNHSSLEEMAQKMYETYPDEFADPKDATRQLIVILDTLGAIE